MSTDPNKFREWCDARGYSATEAARVFGVEPQTIRHWRSGGVPERRKLHVQTVMENHPSGEVPKNVKALMTHQIILQPTNKQLTAWVMAAERSNKNLDEWTSDGLDQLADQELFQKPSLAAEEETGTYGPKPAAASPAHGAGLDATA